LVIWRWLMMAGLPITSSPNHKVTKSER